MAKKEKKIERSLYYYDLELYKYDEIEEKDIAIENFKEVIIDIFAELKNYTTPEDIKIKLDTGNQLFFIVDNIGEKNIDFRMVLVRVGALPYIEKGGTLESLEEILQDDQNIAEITHCVIFPEDKVVGVEFNFVGARSSALSEYIVRMREDITLLTCRPKVNAEVFKKLDGKDGFTLFDFAIKTDSAAFTKLLSKKRAFRAVKEEFSDADTVEVILKKKNRGKTDDKFAPILSIDEMKLLMTDFRDDVERLNVSQGTITKDKVDLLSDKYVKKATFRQINGRVVDTDFVYGEIGRFYFMNIKR